MGGGGRGQGQEGEVENLMVGLTGTSFQYHLAEDLGREIRRDDTKYKSDRREERGRAINIAAVSLVNR